MYDICLLEKPLDEGLTRAEIIDMLDVMSFDEVSMLEINNPQGSSVALGFITMPAFESMDYDSSHLAGFVGNILGNMENENDLGIYEFHNTSGAEPLRIYLSRNID